MGFHFIRIVPGPSFRDVRDYRRIYVSNLLPTEPFAESLCKIASPAFGLMNLYRRCMGVQSQEANEINSFLRTIDLHFYGGLCLLFSLSHLSLRENLRTHWKKSIFVCRCNWHSSWRVIKLLFMRVTSGWTMGRECQLSCRQVDGDCLSEALREAKRSTVWTFFEESHLF